MRVRRAAGLGRLQAIAVSMGLFALAACGGNITPAAYSNLAANLQASGKLRTERAPADAPYGTAELVRAFEDIAFSFEFHFKDDRIVNERLAKPLNRWQGRVRYKLAGDAVTEADIAEVAALARQLSALTGLSIVPATGAHDMLISIATPEGRAAISQSLADQGMPVYQRRYDIWRNSPRWICGATLSGAEDGSERLVYAHIFLGSEATGLLRRSCLHEEIAQSLGLTDDSPAARPSIFNDDQEFALLTEHDAALLRLLYDPRLAPGMTRDEAMPIVAEIAREHLGAPPGAAPSAPRP